MKRKDKTPKDVGDDRDIALMTKIPSWANAVAKEHSYDKCLNIVLYGDPIADSRPRVTGFGAVAVINLQRLKAKFRKLYNNSKLLNELMIDSHYHIACRFYMQTTNVDMKFIKSHVGLHKKYMRDMLVDLNIKDVDNMLKVHNDLLFCNEYRITVDDAYNIGFIDPIKYTSNNPRVEMYVLWSSKPDAWTRYKVRTSTKYFEHQVSYKKYIINKYTPKDQMKYLSTQINNKLEDIRKEADQIKLIKRLADILEQYPADILKEMAGMTTSGRKYTKYDASLKILILLLTKKHKHIAEKLTGLARKTGDDELI